MPEHLTTEKKLWGNLVQHCGSAGKESACNAGELGSIPGLGRSGERKGYPLQYCGLEDSIWNGEFHMEWNGEFHGLYVHGGHKGVGQD